MRAVDIIRKKRDGGALTAAEIASFVSGVTRGEWDDAQAAALLMAVVWRGMDDEETAALTEAMVRSGERVLLGALPGPTVDKHSTGGVGDKTSLVVAPLVAACGGYVPMMSGRGLGHTGGTLDKLEAIPGFRTALTPGEMRAVVERAGCCIAGQTETVAPADRRLYALRDVTATVESLPLICASIMSKKIAEGVGALVLDVKAGRGAFMRSVGEARGLARALVATGERAGLRTEALITDMDAPLGRACGNALEVEEAVEALHGRGPADLRELSLALASRMLVVAGLDADSAAAGVRARAALDGGAALERFRLMVAAQGGDPRVADEPGRLPSAAHHHVLRAPTDGYVVAVHAERVGRAAMLLGAGRARANDRLDPAAGLRALARPGERRAAGDSLVELCYNERARLEPALDLLREAFTLAAEPPAPRPLVLETLSAS
jgi:pyrimidine-nucleoside phosphorylase